jgi:hypothetical protein
MVSLRFSIRAMILLAILSIATPPTVHPQPYPAEGYVGVYFDRAGTQFCGSIPPAVQTTLYILATLNGATRDGITGVELRLEFSRTPGQFVIFTPVPCACITLGNFVDSTACVSDAAGANFAFPFCQGADPIAGAGRVFLGWITILDFGPASPFTIETKRRNPSSDPEHLCPLFVLCDSPVFTEVCMTLQADDPRLGGLEPVAFRSVVNDPNCSGPPGCVVGVESQTWSAVKHLYRD